MTPSWRFRYLRDVVGPLLRMLGPRRTSELGTAIARKLFDRGHPARGLIETNIAAGLGVEPAEATRLARGTFENVARLWAELAFSSRLLSAGGVRAAVRFIEPAAWDALAGSARPSLLVTGDLGNPVVGAAALACRMPPLDVPADAAALAMTSLLWPGLLAGRRVRSLAGLRLHGPRDAGAALTAALASGGRVFMLMGRPRERAIELSEPGVQVSEPRVQVSEPRGLSPWSGSARVPGVEAAFLGRSGRHSAVPARLALRHQADVAVFACVRQRAPMQFELHLLERIRAGQCRTAAELTGRCLAALERGVRAWPEQFLWTRR